MKSKLPPLPQSYLRALRKYLQKGPASALAAARRLGLRALSLGMETLDLARMHEEALTALIPTDAGKNTDTLIRRAGTFFAEAIMPIEETHRGAREANVELQRIVETLTRRTGELASSNEELKQEIAHRKAVEDSLRTSETTSSQLLEKSRRMQEELKYLSRSLLSVQEEERKRISRELHDVIGQALTGITVRLATLKAETTSRGKDLHRKIAVTQRLVEKSVDIVHRFARDLRPAVLDDLGLIPALQSYVKGYIAQTGIAVDIETFAGVEKLSGTARIVLYRVVQESLANVSRHAHASRAVVSIRKFRGRVQMNVTDNGRGFVVDTAAIAESSKRLGLLGMRERVEMAGGTFCVESTLGKETTIRVEIPYGKVSANKTPARKSGNAILVCP
jgi:signal transduction histidine kinase